MYKDLISTDTVGLTIDTDEWMLGITVIRRLGENRASILLQISFLCLHLFIALRDGRYQ